MIFYKTKTSETVRVDSGRDCLPKTNTAPFTPTDDYNPATKKYVDDSIGGISKILDAINRKPDNPAIEPFYLYDGSTGRNKLGEFTIYNSQNSPQISVSDSITVVVNELGGIINFLSQNRSFNISGISKYHKMGITFECVSGNISCAIGYYLPGSPSVLAHRFLEFGNGIGTDTKYVNLSQDFKDILIGTSTDYQNHKFGFALTPAHNNGNDTVFKIYKIWLE